MADGQATLSTTASAPVLEVNPAVPLARFAGAHLALAKAAASPLQPPARPAPLLRKPFAPLHDWHADCRLCGR